MSEPLSTNDIEDVVSSVRRLVSPEARPRVMSRDLGMDRLILTPSLRIVAEQPASGPTVVKLEAVPKKSRVSAKKARPGAGKGATAKSAPVPVMAPAEDMRAPEATPDFGQSGLSLSEMALRAEEAELIVGDDSVKPQAKPRKASAKTRPPAEPVVETVAEAAAEPAPVVVSGDVPAAKAVSKPAKPKAAKPKPPKLAAVETKAAPSSRKPSGSSSSAVAPVVALPDAANDAGKPLKARKSAGRAESAPVEAAPVMEPVAEAPDSLAPGAVEAAAEPVVVVETAAVLPLEATVPEADASATEQASPVGLAAPTLTDTEGNPISLLDEDALVLILRRLIREELQGVLGEKITRNVRKLVRAEVARSLTEQTLE